jgi:hypothetical protein
MRAVKGEVVILAPIHEVFAYASDWREWSHWFEGVSQMRPLTANTQGDGAQFQYRATYFGVPVTVETEIHDFEHNRGWRGVTLRGPKSQTVWSFEAVPNGTMFTFELQYELPRGLGFLDAIVMRPGWRRSLERTALNLKQRLESGITAVGAR